MCLCRLAEAFGSGSSSGKSCNFLLRLCLQRHSSDAPRGPRRGRPGLFLIAVLQTVLADMDRGRTHSRGLVTATPEVWSITQSVTDKDMHANPFVSFVRDRLGSGREERSLDPSIRDGNTTERLAFLPGRSLRCLYVNGEV